MTPYDELLDDLAAEHRALDAVLARMTDAQWDLPSHAPGWLVRDQVAHLAHFDEAAALAIADAEAFRADAAARAGGDRGGFEKQYLGRGRAMPPAELRAWWRANADAGRTSVLFAYALGKAQRVLAGLRDSAVGPIYTHGAIERLNRDYRDSGVALADTTYAGAMPRGHDYAGGLVLAPPSAGGSLWLRRFGAISTGFASGWMRIRGARRRRSIDRGHERGEAPHATISSPATPRSCSSASPSPSQRLATDSASRPRSVSQRTSGSR